jgi:hypothetical protein
MATFEGTRSPKCCPWTNQGYLTFPHTPPWPRPDPREAYTRAYPNRVGPPDLTLEGPPGHVAQKFRRLLGPSHPDTKTAEVSALMATSRIIRLFGPGAIG